MILDIEIFEEYEEDTWPQAKYLVHGTDVLWTNSLDDALNFLKESIIELEKKE